MDDNIKTIKSSYDNEVDKLKSKTRDLKQSFTDQLYNLTMDSNQAIKVGAAALGVAIGGFLIYKLVSNAKAKKQKHTFAENGAIALTKMQSAGLGIVEMIKGAMASFILSIARDKIISFIERVNQKGNDAVEGLENAAAAKK